LAEEVNRYSVAEYAAAGNHGADPWFFCMEKEMRQAKKEIRQESIMRELLAGCHVGRLGTVGRDGYPMIKPLNFVYHGGKIYFHSAREGEKINDINRDNRVCFEADLPIAQVKTKGSPCRSHYLYRSVIIRGRAGIVRDESERVSALTRLMEKFQPEGGYGDFPGDKLSLTEVIRIDIEEMVGKEDLGTGQIAEAARRALDEKQQLPIVLERD
jgi:nitroimidazol reductase NimA-like FMN-containing flavoprotein (pyridoxamine 5'-phosphate oxidase superfamily)